MAKDRQEAYRLADELVKLTEPGPVRDWVERMADVVRTVGIDMSYIAWNDSPRSVGHSIAQTVASADLEKELKAAIDELRETAKAG